MWLRRPTSATVNRYLRSMSSQPLSYPHVGASNSSGCPSGYVVDCNRSCLGTGGEVFDRACAALRSWRMFDLPWLLLAWPDAPIEPGAIVAPVIYFGGVWWANACQIVYVMDDDRPHRRFGFAYGTLLGHLERGEERFLVEMLPDGGVWFEIRAFSQAAKLLSRIAYPLVRRGQLRFFADAHAAMLRAVTKT